MTAARLGRAISWNCLRATNALKQAKSEFASFEKLFAKPANPRPFPALAPLAGTVASPVFGKGMLQAEGEALVLELKDTGAERGEGCLYKNVGNPT